MKLKQTSSSTSNFVHASSRLMNSTKVVLLSLAVLAFITVDARKLLTSTTFQDKMNAEKHTVLKSAPIVEDKQFQFPDDTNQQFYWRVDMTPPVLRVGWQTDQSANSKDLTFNFNPASFQSNPRLGVNGAIFNKPPGSVRFTPEAAPGNPGSLTCTSYFACYAGNSGTSGNEATAITNTASDATSKLPCFPSVSGQCDVTVASPAPINNALSTLTPAPVASEGDYVNVGKKYQYWAVKLKPYLETQFSLQNKIYVDQLLQLDLNFDVTSFKSYLWGEASIWYQYDSSNPKAPLQEFDTNYRNYFLCGGLGVTVKPILMSITFAIKLRNCYKTIIQSLTDWSNWTKLGPDALYFGILDYCKNSDSETVTVFSYNPVSTDFNYILAGNLENNDPSFDWNGGESTGTYADGNMKNSYQFNYCYPIKTGNNINFAPTDFNEYELYNGGPNGDLWCRSDPTATSNFGWRPKTIIPTPAAPSTTWPKETYDITKKPSQCA